MAANRFRLIVGKPFKGPVDTFEMDKFAFGKVRSFADSLKFSGVTFEVRKNDTNTCPYTDLSEVAIVGVDGSSIR
jgi:hypothetical protein